MTANRCKECSAFPMSSVVRLAHHPRCRHFDLAEALSAYDRDLSTILAELCRLRALTSCQLTREAIDALLEPPLEL